MVSHRSDYTAITLHEDYVVVCQGDICQALILTIIENVQERISEDSDEINPFVPLSHREFTEEMQNIYKRHSVIRALDALLQNQLIERRQHDKSYDYTYEYRLNEERLQQLIDALPEKISGPERPLNLRYNPDYRFSLKKQTLLQKFGYLCAYCQSAKAITWDHIIPKAKGGRNALANLVPACMICNSSKRDQDVYEWMKSQQITPCATLQDILTNLEVEVRPEQ